jgi:hypothetical protein
MRDINGNSRQHRSGSAEHPLGRDLPPPTHRGRVARRPDALAVSFDDAPLPYHENEAQRTGRHIQVREAVEIQ